MIEMDTGSRTQYPFYNTQTKDIAKTAQRDEIKPGFDFLW